MRLMWIAGALVIGVGVSFYLLTRSTPPDGPAADSAYLHGRS